MFSLNSIGCVTKCGPAGILEGNTTDRCMYNNCAQIFEDTERFEVIFFNPHDEEQAHGATK